MNNIRYQRKIIQYGLIIFWSLFWLLNVVDKFISGPAFLFVGTDRFAQLFKFFSSIGLENSNIALGALALTTIIEITALIFTTAALWYLFSKKDELAQSTFFWGTFTGLLLFTYFIVGDQIFGDRSEVLEHTLIWITLMLSWVIYAYLPLKERVNEAITKTISFPFRDTLIISSLIVLISFASILALKIDADRSIEQQAKVVIPQHLGNGIYKFTFMFLDTGKIWEDSLLKFTSDNSNLRVTEIYTMPKQFLKGKAENVVILVLTEPR